jgi:hypothetical protein
MGQLNKIWDREAMLLGMNEPEVHDVLVKQVQFIEIVRPAPKPGDQPSPPIHPIPPVPVTDAVPPPPVAAPSPPDQPSSGVQPPPQDNDRAPEMTKPQDDTGQLRIEVNRPKEVK